MNVKHIPLSPEQLTRLETHQFDHGEQYFRTEGGNSSRWRRLLAFDPIASFVLRDFTDLRRLKSFLHENRSKLCAGYLSYDLGLKLKDISSQHSAQVSLATFHAYDQWVEIGEDNLSLINLDKQAEGKLFQWLETHRSRDVAGPSPHFEPSVQQLEYKRNIEMIQTFIRSGDFYQVNYTQQLHAETSDSPRDLFNTLIRRHPAEYACYFETGDLAIHSLSPELFLHYDAGRLTTKPIKGTRPRSSDSLKDEAFRLELLSSEKEQAELFMITDLMRNDLGKVCEVGSVKLEALKNLKKLPKVWHTYSQISGMLHSDLLPIDALLSMFPGGSITGCPKRRALEVIDELEISARGIYTGSVGYFHPDGDFSFNIAIRTLIQQDKRLILGSGGGITIDSDWQSEWNELMLKVSTFE